MKRRLLIALAIALALAGLLLIIELPALTHNPKPCAGERGACVTYVIHSNALYYEVQYFTHNPFTNSTTYARGDWQLTTEIIAGKDAYITGYNPMPSGTIACEIWIDGVLVHKSEPKNGFGLAICDYEVR